ncbi:MAG TPA: DUF1990 family protein [Acidimicrobiales bacterium]|nr:DUF1990 family protein [Acidimicrobiales bacterium]
MAVVSGDANRVAPRELARFTKISGAEDRMAKEVQSHMWTSVLERVAGQAGGRLDGGIDAETRRVEAGRETEEPGGPSPLRDSGARRVLDELHEKAVNFDVERRDEFTPEQEWLVDDEGHPVRVWGWNYRTLQGHLEMGQMDFEVWKWLDTGQVEFRARRFSRHAHVRNPVVRLGLWVFGRREQVRFAERACARMAGLTAAGLRRPSPDVARAIPPA